MNEPVSIVIPGQTAAYQAPATFTDTQGRIRVKSFTAETAAGGTGSYTWNNLTPGTFLYQTGSHPAVQAQMGLYGALKVYPATAGRAYGNASTAYNTEVTLLYSEIDRGLHDAVATGKYGSACTSPPCTMTSTIDYQADYFLINGQPFQVGVTSPLPAGSDTQTTLIRFLNAGLRSHVPTLLGSYLKLIAEDGNLYPYAKEQYSVLLAAGKTIDALWAPICSDTYKLYDHTLHLTTGGQPGGGMLAYLDVTGTICLVPPVPATPPDSNVGTVSITGNPVNGAPRFTAGPNQTVTMPAAAQTVPNWATNISPGPPAATDKSGQAGDSNGTSITGNRP